MIDAHCHLNFKAFENDLDIVIKDAQDSGVNNIIIVGADLDSSRKAVEIANKYDNVFASVGIHPHHVDKIDNSFIKEFETLAQNKKVIAIGEIGMDNHRYKSNSVADPILQKEIFIQQIELAYRLKLPLQIHNRHAEKEVSEILLGHKSDLLNPPGMIHCFSGSLEFLRTMLDLRFYIGFDGNITYEGLAPGETTDLRELVKATPIDRILTETDSPYLAPIPLRNVRNVPKNVIIIGEFISSLKGLKTEEFWPIITKNFKKVFDRN